MQSQPSKLVMRVRFPSPAPFARSIVKAGSQVFAGLPAPVQIRNQARVHHWYEQRFGVLVPPTVVKFADGHGLPLTRPTATLTASACATHG
jgi:hypothetical protein